MRKGGKHGKHANTIRISSHYIYWFLLSTTTAIWTYKPVIKYHILISRTLDDVRLWHEVYKINIIIKSTRNLL